MAQLIIKLAIIDPRPPIHIPLAVFLHPRFELNNIPFLQSPQLLEAFGHIEPEMVRYYLSINIADGGQEEGLCGRAFIAGFEAIFFEYAPEWFPLLV